MRGLCFRNYENSSSETQGQIVGTRESLNGRKNVARRKVKNGEKLSAPGSPRVTKTMTPKFTVKFGLKGSGKDQTR